MAEFQWNDMGIFLIVYSVMGMREKFLRKVLLKRKHPAIIN